MPSVAPQVNDLLSFLDSSPSPYHARFEVEKRLVKAGYVEYDEREAWNVQPGTRGYVVRGGAALAAFEVGAASPAEAGLLIVGAHTDSPCLRLRPTFERHTSGMVQALIEPYGGLLLHTWFDRGLSLAGRVVTRHGETALVHIPRPIAIIPSLAIHLQRDVTKQGLVVDPESHLRPLLGVRTGELGSAESEPPASALLSQVADQASLVLGHRVATEDISGADLGFLDARPAELVGLDNEFVSSGRLDNLVSVHAGLSALLEEKPDSPSTRLLILHDHEEVGSRSTSGAWSTFLSEIVERLSLALSPTDPVARHRATARSLLLSVDMAHGVHPNFEHRHEEHHRPHLGGGPVLKVNTNQSYATDAVVAGTFAVACERAGVLPQRFVTRNDIACGSTIGPISAARTGIRTVDIGNPMLGMHSCRELCAAADLVPLISVIAQWYQLARSPAPRD